MKLNKLKSYFLLVAAALFLTGGVFAQTSRSEPVKTGDTAPDFVLTTNDGKTVTLSEVVKTAPVVLVFYRGSWCPFCVRQLADLRGLLTDGEKTRLYAVSVDSPETNNKLVQKIEKDGKGKINYAFLTDAGAKTIDAYGLRDPRYKDEKVDGIPYPTVYVIGGDRKVVWSKLEKDYKNRPTNQEIRAEIDKLSSSKTSN